MGLLVEWNFMESVLFLQKDAVATLRNRYEN